MMRILIGIFFFLLPFITPAQSDAFPEEFTHRIVVLGSSTAAGHGPSEKDSAWVNRFRSYLKSFNPENEVINLAKGGYTTYHLMPDNYITPKNRQKVDTLRNITRALTFYPTSIIINLPSNDAGWGYSNDQQIINLNIIIETAHRENIPVWICSPQPRNFKDEKILRQQEELNRIMSEKYPNIIDFWSGFENPDFTLKKIYDSGDGTHLNNAGHRILSNRVIEQQVWNDTTIDFFKSKLNYFQDTSLLLLDKSLPQFYESKELFEQYYKGWYNDRRFYAERVWQTNLQGVLIEREEHITVIYDPKIEKHRGMGHAESTIYARILDASGKTTAEWVEVSLDIDYRNETTTIYYQPTKDDQIYRLTLKKNEIEEIDFLKKLCFFYLSGTNSRTTLKIVTDQKTKN